LKVRSIRRSHIDIISSTWKWLAGSPGSRDFKIIQEKINSALSNNNQVILNRLIIYKINKITLANRNLINRLNYEGDAQSTTSLFQIQMLKEEILNLNLLLICKHKNMIDISNSSCLSNLLKSRPATCIRINNQHTSTIDEIAPGVILLNKFSGKISVNGKTSTLNGLFVINFSNTTIEIDEQAFTNKYTVHH